MSSSLALALLLFYPSTTFASWFTKGKESGWFWKKDEVKKKKEKKKVEKKNSFVPLRATEQNQPQPLLNKRALLLSKLPVHLTAKDLEKLTPEQVAKLYSLYVDRALYQPNEADYKNILLIQDYAMKKSVAYVYALQDVLRKHPEWNPAVEHPPSTYGRRVEYVAQKRKIDDLLAKWKDRAGLYFFFESTCPYCKAQSVVLKRFQKFTGWQVLPVSIDGQCLDSYPDCQADYGQLSAKLNITHYPAIFLVIPNFKNGKPLLQPVSYGLTTLDALKNSIYSILYTIENGHPPDVSKQFWKVAKGPNLQNATLPAKFKKLTNLLNEVGKRAKKEEVSKEVEQQISNQLWGR